MDRQGNPTNAHRFRVGVADVASQTKTALIL